MAGEITLVEMNELITSLRKRILCDWDDRGEIAIVEEQVHQVLAALDVAASHARIGDLWKTEAEIRKDGT